MRKPLWTHLDGLFRVVFTCSLCYLLWMLNVVYLPGLLGSDLGYDRLNPFPPQPVWLDSFQLATGGAALLQLAADGESPGPMAQGLVVYPTAIFAPAYAPLGLFMLGLGWNVLVMPYDWRKSVISSARRVLDAINERFGTQPIYIVAHSQGGLVARAVWKLMAESGRDKALLRIVTIATPQYGSMEPVRLLCRLPALYIALVVATGWPPTLLSEAGPAYLDDVIASWPGIYELLPFLAAGPLPTLAPALAPLLWQAGFYAGGNPFLQQQALDTALLSQEYLLDAVPPGRMVSIVGTGQNTTHLPSGQGSPLTDGGYLFTQDGDGTVALDYASLPGVPRLIMQASHAGILLNPAMWALLPFILTSGLAADLVI